VELVDPEPGPDNVRAVAAGRYDLCLTSVAHYLNAQAGGELDARFVLVVTRRSHMAAFAIRGRPGAHGREIVSLHDLPGASFLGPAESAFTREYLALLERLHGTPGPHVERPYPEVMEALAAGDGDVGVDFLDLLPRFEAAARPRGLELRALPVWPSAAPLYGSGVVAGGEVIATRPKALASFVAAAREAFELTRRAPDAGLEALLRRFVGVEREYALTGWHAGAPLIFGDVGEPEALAAMDPGTWRATIEHHARIHGTPRLAPERVFDSTFAGRAPSLAPRGV
jgi:ABC-type nitrate/sulfonate/bicarbonate transport system substrate-binding protein